MIGCIHAGARRHCRGCVLRNDARWDCDIPWRHGVRDNKRSPDRKSDLWSQNISILSDLSDFEVVEVTTIVTDNKRSPDRKSDMWSQNISVLSDFEVVEVALIVPYVERDDCNDVFVNGQLRRSRIGNNKRLDGQVFNAA
jgi:hypothetical protein